MMDLKLGGLRPKNRVDASAMEVDALNHAVRIVGNLDEW
jgi:hypothetical protein